MDGFLDARNEIKFIDLLNTEKLAQKNPVLIKTRLKISLFFKTIFFPGELQPHADDLHLEYVLRFLYTLLQ